MGLLFGGSVLDGFDHARITTGGVFRLGGVEFQCSEHRTDARRLEFRTPRLTEFHPVRIRVDQTAPMFGHLYTPGPYLLFNLFPGSHARPMGVCGAHLLWMVRGEMITVVERTVARRLPRRGVTLRAIGLRVSAGARGERAVVTLDGLGADVAISDAILACASQARSGAVPAWPTGSGVQRFVF